MLRHELDETQTFEILETLENRFNANMDRHKNITWEEVVTSINRSPDILNSLYFMEETGGEPDVVVLQANKSLTFYDCAKETPVGRRKLCYDDEALESRKANKPEGSAVSMAKELGANLLTEQEYRNLQEVFPFDEKTSSWIQTPEKVRGLGGALFCDRRYDQVFTYHNGADSYYGARGFRVSLKL